MGHCLLFMPAHVRVGGYYYSRNSCGMGHLLSQALQLPLSPPVATAVAVVVGATGCCRGHHFPCKRLTSSMGRREGCSCGLCLMDPVHICTIHIFNIGWLLFISITAALSRPLLRGCHRRSWLPQPGRPRSCQGSIMMHACTLSFVQATCTTCSTCTVVQVL